MQNQLRFKFSFMKIFKPKTSNLKQSDGKYEGVWVLLYLWNGKWDCEFCRGSAKELYSVALLVHKCDKRRKKYKDTWNRQTRIFLWLLRTAKLTCNQSLLQRRSVQVNNLFSCWKISVMRRKTGNIYRSAIEFDLITSRFNPLNAELNSICHLLALLGGATIVVVSRLGVNAHLISSTPPTLKIRFALTFIRCLWCEFGLFLRGHQLQRNRLLQGHPAPTEILLFLIFFRTRVSKCRRKNIQLRVSVIFFKTFPLLGNNCFLWLLLVSRRK